jgi:pyruvate carboxylase
MGAIIGATRGTNLETGINPLHARLINDYWEQTRLVYAPFESPSLRSGNSDVYVHEMPGGQYTNLQFQAHKLGLGSQWPQIKTAYAQANQVLGDIIKVTPSSKVVGDLAQFMVQNGLDEKSVVEQAETLSFPSSVVSFLRGEIGIPHSGFPEPFRSRVLKDSPRIEGRPGVSLSPLDFNALKTKLIEKWGIGTIRDVDVVSAALYPKVFDEFADFKNRFGDVTILPTRYFFAPASIDEEISINIQKGRVLFIKLLAVGRLLSNGEREVFWEANGNARAIVVQDRCTAVAIEKRLKADPYNLGSIGAPMGGVVLEIRVKETSIVKVGDPLVILSAMKMETVVTSPVSGVVSTLHVKAGDSLDAGDLILLITQHN